MHDARPNFLIAGAARCGTTALAMNLEQHPEVFVSSPKEVHFYAHADSPVTYRGPGDELMMNSRVVTEPETFLGLFEPGRDHARRGDGSVSTLVRPEVSIPNIRRHAAEDVRVIVMLREPVARAHSSYLYLRGRGHETVDDFEEALALEPGRARDGYHHMWRYRELSRYRSQLEPFVDEFGDRLRIVILEEYKDAEADMHAGLCRFLGIDDGFRFGESGDVNRGGEPRSPFLAKWMNIARSQPLVQRAVKRVTSATFRERIRSRNLVRPELDESLRRRLAADFVEDVEYVEHVVGRTIAAWRA